MGDNYNSLKETWSSPGLSKLRAKAQEFQDELENYNEEEFKDYIFKIPATAKNLKLKGSDRAAFYDYFLAIILNIELLFF